MSLVIAAAGCAFWPLWFAAVIVLFGFTEKKVECSDCGADWAPE